jgi:uncharacterized protein YbbK (DUF523 family)/uncharacterized protein YbgA (DUF1722 family)
MVEGRLPLASSATRVENVRRSSGGHRPIRVAVSACLLGHAVRYDGGHKRDAFVTETLERFVEIVPVCPEVELGLGVPRETLRLERRGDEIRMIGNNSACDHTIAMREYAEQRLDTLASLELCGYVLKQNSPSCGLEGVAILGGGYPRPGRGLFAAALTRRWPLLPVEEETRLTDIPSRENFLERIFAYHRLRSLFKNRWTHANLVSFHRMHELQLLAHSPRLHSALGRLVSAASPGSDVRRLYEMGFMRAMSKVATPAQHVRVLRQVAASIRLHLGAKRRGELDAAIRDYQAGSTPLFVPISLVHRYAQQFEIDYLKCQTYFEPYPPELIAQRSG